MNDMSYGSILKALSGFYYVYSDGRIYTCRARGKHRHAGIAPLVGDRVSFSVLSDGAGALDDILPRRNEFQRPAVANVDQLVLVASQAIPVTDPFLIDRLTVLAETRGCRSVICVNKCDLDAGEELYRIYAAAGYPTVRVSAETGEGIETLRGMLRGRISVLSGNSGVGKSSLLNALYPHLVLSTGEVSVKLGRGKHTTRHVELYAAERDTLIADTPGFSSFDAVALEGLKKAELADAFPDFRPFAGKCRFLNCAHRKEPGCGILQAVEDGRIERTRHASYVKLYDQLSAVPEWKL